MFSEDFRFINQQFYAEKVSPQQLDELLEKSWRHFGKHFFRYNLGFYQNEIRVVMPLRIRLADFARSKSQRKILRKNADLQTVIRHIRITPATENLFERHKQRFDHGVPDSVYDFLDTQAANVPCKALECAVYLKNELVAVSFFDVGAVSVSGIYACFAPEITERSLGIFTMLLEIEFARENGKAFYYQGYAYEGSSFYDYKKRFSALEKYDWNDSWEKFSEDAHADKLKSGEV
jgi:leucyl-tRNA---protein transferase